MAGASPAAPYPEPVRHRLAIVFTVIGAIALPIVMAATVLYASDAAIGDAGEPLAPHFGTTALAKTTPAHPRRQHRSGQNAGGDDHGGSTGSGGSSGSDSSGSGSGSSGDDGSGGDSGGSSDGGGDD